MHSFGNTPRAVSRSLCIACMLTALAACGGESDGRPHGPSATASSGQGSGQQNEFESAEAFFQARISPRLDFCRSCHIPGGVADTPEGERFMLSSNSGDDYANLQAAWQVLGEGVAGNLLIVENSDPAEPHSGGKNWPQGSEAYNDMITLLSCWDDPQNCVLNAAGDVLDALPLLGSARGGHAWFDFCDGDGTQDNPRQPDDARLPADPRSLVKPGISDGKAVHFNFYWKDCHIDPERVNERPHPQTCGELRESYARGAVLMEGKGQVGTGTTFAGSEPNGYAAYPASQHNQLWRIWGLPERPDNFDELFAQRYGFGEVDPENPYPLPGEDPNETHGGSGRLPVGMTQTRNPDGTWTGNVSTNCQGCHSTVIGTAEDGPGLGTVYGAGGSLLDAAVASADIMLLGNPAGIAIDRLGLGGRVRGTNNAQFSNITAVAGVSSPEQFLGVITNGSTATGDTPAWWNVGHRPLKFVDGMFPGDAVRVDFALYTPLLDKRPLPTMVTEGPDAVYEWVSEHVQDGDHWIMGQKSPAYPMPVDTTLAEQGAVLFHNKDLWADETENPTPRPEGGNGSCASCHGAYSPRYVNDPGYLADPALEGIASYVVPMDIIDTDPVRMQTYNEGTNQALSNSYVGYPETAGTEQDCRVQNMDALRGDREKGYAAPPLYGVWATAPYFHNGSVPNVRQVLMPEERPQIWRRVSRPARPDQEGQVVMGFDTDLARAYDEVNMGWKYDELPCGSGALPYLACTPLDPVNAALQTLLDPLYGNLLGAWNITNPPKFSNADIEERKIYNTGMFSQGNGGHAFTSVLTEQEVTAIIEYLKTL